MLHIPAPSQLTRFIADISIPSSYPPQLISTLYSLNERCYGLPLGHNFYMLAITEHPTANNAESRPGWLVFKDCSILAYALDTDPHNTERLIPSAYGFYQVDMNEQGKARILIYGCRTTLPCNKFRTHITKLE